jgi:transposase
MKKGIIELLGLQGYLVDRIDVQDGISTVQCRSPRRFVPCPKCRITTKKVHQKKYRILRHGKMNGTKITLRLLVRRMYCPVCHKVFTEVLPGVSNKRSTDQFYRFAFELLISNSFRWTGRYCGISPSALVKQLISLQKQWHIDWDGMGAEIILGVDEHSFRGKIMVITITDLVNHKLLAVLKGDQQSYLEEFIHSIPKTAQTRVVEVCTDLRFSYRSVVERMWPEVQIVADRYHVERQAKYTMDKIRSVIQSYEPKKYQAKDIMMRYANQLNEAEQKRLKFIFNRYQAYPVLKEMWLIKEQIRRIYFCSHKKDALKQFNHCLMLLETAHRSSYIVDLKRTLRRWKEQILNYYDRRTTNGFTEGCHTKIKLIKRTSFGFRNINNYIAKVTLAFLPLLFILNHHTI